MLSLAKTDRAIARVNHSPADADDEQVIYLDESGDNDARHAIAAPREHLVKIFEEHVKLDKRLTMRDVKELVDAYRRGVDELDGKLSRRYYDAKRYADESPKKFLIYPRGHELFPIIDFRKTSQRVFVSGQSNSGKSYLIAELLRRNKPGPQQAILMFSPFQHDTSYRELEKRLIRVDLDEFEKEEKRAFSYEDIPPNAIAIFDDIESSLDPARAKQLMHLRDVVLERGRHDGVSCITVSHNPLGANKTKASIRESGWLVCFPKTNSRDTRALLTKYAGFSARQVDELLDADTRWVVVCKRVPTYWVAQHAVRVL